MLAIQTATPTPAVSMPANLFSSCGKLAVRITSLGEDRATVIAQQRPPSGSFAFLVRNGVRLATLVAWAEGNCLGLSFEEPLTGHRREDAFRAA